MLPKDAACVTCSSFHVGQTQSVNRWAATVLETTPNHKRQYRPKDRLRAAPVSLHTIITSLLEGDWEALWRCRHLTQPSKPSSACLSSLLVYCRRTQGECPVFFFVCVMVVVLYPCGCVFLIWYISSLVLIFLRIRQWTFVRDYCFVHMLLVLC